MGGAAKPVAIVGGGLAGLTAATFLRRHGLPVVLHEAGERLAGLAASHHDADGFTYDFGAHFITNRLAAAIGVGAQCRDVAYYGESVSVRGRTHAYPAGLLAEPRYLTSALRARLRDVARGGPPVSAADWFRSRYGVALADEVALPLVESWSGAPADQLAPAIGEKLEGNGVGRSLFLKLAGRVLGRAVAIGYSHELPARPTVWHVYPQSGVSLLCRALAEPVADVIRLGSPVEAITVDAGRVVAVRAAGREQEVAAVVSTAPCHVLARMVRGSDALRPLARFRYRPMIFVNMRFEGRGLLPDTVLWTPGEGRPFFRLTEATRSMPWLAPPGRTLITADIGCETGEPAWAMPDEALGELCLDALAELVPGARRLYRGCRVLRTPIAYPVFRLDYEPARQAFERGTGVAGLYSIGRNGEFAHILMEDVYWRTLRRLRPLVEAAGRPATARAALDLSGVPA